MNGKAFDNWQKSRKKGCFSHFGLSGYTANLRMRKKLNVEMSPNKLFKRDSQRVAFSLCVGFSV
ncbi:TPA: hypothetical protein O4H39_004559 [Vibrio alginolyticus]|uniref:hypothetical protein n=1 Tax=Vibrio TaxID=662 RepID=UPI001482DDD3|nr:hypothetical protein [Vibrio sp. 2-1(7)]HCZ9397289.1 hypothetical protein [Vibrio alginolyticus]